MLVKGDEMRIYNLLGSWWKLDVAVGGNVDRIAWEMEHQSYLWDLIDGLMQDRCSSIANALELRLSCTALTYRHKLTPTA